MRKRTQTFYCMHPKDGEEVRAGVEVAEAERRGSGEGGKTSGRVALRFFNCAEAKESQVYFLMDPQEAFGIHCQIVKAVRSEEPTKVRFTHSFEKGGDRTKVTTTVGVEKWARNGKSGYALTAHRGEASHNVSFTESGILFLAELLKFFSCAQSWEAM